MISDLSIEYLILRERSRRIWCKYESL